MANNSSEDIEVGLIHDNVMPYFYTINLSIGCGVFSLFGIVTNIINIVIFVRQGFHETINISLLGLAISDLCSLIALLFVSICFNPFFMYSNLPVITTDLQDMPGGWTHVIFTRVTGFITVFITFERCLCITVPLKIKHILTPRRVCMIIVAIYVVVIGSMSHIYGLTQIAWTFIRSRNRTMLASIYVMDFRTVRPIQFSMFYIQLVYPLFSFTAVILFSCVLILKLNERRRWRQSASVMKSDDKSLARDRQVVKLVVAVAVVFIATFTPSLALFVAMAVVPGVNRGLKNENLFVLLYSIAFVMEAINSCVNIFVYYKTSSKYKEHFKSMFSFTDWALHRKRN